MVGYGSIGRRHATLLADAGFAVELVTSQRVPALPCHSSVSAAMAHGEFGLVVVANPAVAHAATLDALCHSGYGGVILVEKPLTDRPAPAPDLASRVRVGYNLRFLPIVARIRELIAGRRLLSMTAQVGQYLPEWRPGRDYRTCVSSQRAFGGGALRELSHELDLAQHLAGTWVRVAAAGGNSRSLQIDVEDDFGLLLECAGCPYVRIVVDFLDRIGQRRLTIHAQGLTLHADLISGTLALGGDVEGVERYAVEDRDHSYRRQLQDVLKGGGVACTWAQAMDVVKLIVACEASNASATWVYK